MLPEGTYYGPTSMFADKSALVVETNGLGTVEHAWPLCAGLLALGGGKVLIHTEAKPETWQPLLDALPQQDPQNAITRIKWRPSRYGGRLWAKPGGTRTQLAAVQRTKGGRVGQTAPRSNVAEVRPRGAGACEDAQVFRALMAHLQRAAGLNLQETGPGQEATPGTWRSMAAEDPTAPRGRMRLVLRDDLDVQRLFDELHERAVQVGGDMVGVQVLHDIHDAQLAGGRGAGTEPAGGQGNGRRRGGGRPGPSSARR